MRGGRSRRELRHLDKEVGHSSSSSTTCGLPETAPGTAELLLLLPGRLAVDPLLQGEGGQQGEQQEQGEQERHGGAGWTPGSSTGLSTPGWKEIRLAVCAQ